MEISSRELVLIIRGKLFRNLYEVEGGEGEI